MKIILIRHTSVDVPKGVCYGNTDVSLASTFPAEARAVKSRLSSYRLERVYSSPSKRCVELARFCGYTDAITDPRLKELNFGDWEMKRYDMISDPTLQTWYEDYINVRPPGGESVVDQRKRLDDFITEIRRKHPDSQTGIFTHGGILINALVAYGNKTYDEVYRNIPPYGAIIEIEV